MALKWVVTTQELASKSCMMEDVVAALRNEEAAKLAAQHDAQAAHSRIHQLEVCFHRLSQVRRPNCMHPQETLPYYASIPDC